MAIRDHFLSFGFLLLSVVYPVSPLSSAFFSLGFGLWVCVLTPSGLMHVHKGSFGEAPFSPGSFCSSVLQLFSECFVDKEPKRLMIPVISKARTEFFMFKLR